MTVLAFDTVGRSLTAALETEELYLENRRDAGLRHGETLLPLIDSLLREAEIEPPDLDLVVCTGGPGSFTGLRIGLASAKGLASALSIPFAAVPTLDALAASWQVFPGLTAPIVDARKKRIYTRIYRGEQALTEPQDISPADFLSLAADAVYAVSGKECPHPPLLLTGPAPHLVPGTIEAAPEPFSQILRAPAPAVDGRALVARGKKILAETGPSSPDCGPLYLRKSEAEITLQSGA